MTPVEQRFLTGAREEDRDEPGLVLEDDGTVWLVAADGTRMRLPGAGNLPDPAGASAGAVLLTDGAAAEWGGFAFPDPADASEGDVLQVGPGGTLIYGPAASGSLSLPLDLGPGLFQVSADGNAMIHPSEQASDAGMIRLLMEDDLVNQAGYGVFIGALDNRVANPAWGTDHIFMLTVNGLDIKAPAEEGDLAQVRLSNRVNGNVATLSDSALTLLDEVDPSMRQIIAIGSIGLFGAVPVGQQTLDPATCTPQDIANVLEAFGLTAAA